MENIYATASNLTSTFKPTLSSDLYHGVQYDNLSSAQQLWARWYTYIGDPVLATGIMSFFLHELVYFGRCVPWIIVDAIPYFRRWKLQEDKVPTKKEQWECTKYVLFTHVSSNLFAFHLYFSQCIVVYH